MTRFVPAFALWTLLVAGTGASASAQGLLDRVIARVGEHAITLTDLRGAIGFGLIDTAPGAAAPVQQLIDRRLVLLELMRRPPPPPDPAAIDAEVERLRAAAGAGLGALMASTGVDHDRLRAIARDNLRIAAYLADRFPLVPASDADAEQYYRAHPDEFVRDGTPAPFGTVVSEARTAAARERRDTRIAGWLATLRNRTDVAIVPDGDQG